MKKLTIMLLAGLMLAGCSSSESAVKNLNESMEVESVEVDEQVKETVYGVGDIIDITKDEGEYSFTITEISETQDRNQFSDIQADRVIIIDYSYENINMDNELFLFQSNFKVYDADGNQLEDYPASVKYAGSVGAGRKTSGQMAYALNNDVNEIEIEYFDNMFNSKKDCLIKVSW